MLKQVGNHNCFTPDSREIADRYGRLTSGFCFVQEARSVGISLSNPARHASPASSMPPAFAGISPGSVHLTTLRYVTGWISQAVARQLRALPGAVFSDSPSCALSKNNQPSK